MALIEPHAGHRRRRILLLTPRWPYPITGGDRLRIWHLAREVSRLHELTLLSFCQTEAEMNSPLPADGVFSSVHRVLLPRWRSWAQMLMALPTRSPLQVAYYRSAAFGQEVQRLEPTHDLLWCHLVRMAPYAAVGNRPRWLEMTDAISLTMSRAAQALSWWNPVRLAFAMEAVRLRRLEIEAARRFDLVTVVSTVDRNAIDVAAPASSKLVVAPNGVDAPSLPTSRVGGRALGVAFLGRMDSVANRDALRYFTREVWPAVLAIEPQARLHVIGHVPAREAARLGRQDGVLLHGIVPDLGPVLAQCRVGVCPVRIGAGVQNKLLDYMAHGLAAVTSPIGLEGLDAVPGRHLLVAEKTGDWVAAITVLLQDDRVADSIAREGQALVQLTRRWPESLSPALHAVDRLFFTS
ncbi:glycosyltransferase [Ideonella sp. YS5]|uniref:glycosyltransferase n=1 Tax=Ideonella sp. YS5 TaxID=3453714 RepID=UPI003EEBECE8